MFKFAFSYKFIKRNLFVQLLLDEKKYWTDIVCIYFGQYWLYWHEELPATLPFCQYCGDIRKKHFNIPLLKISNSKLTFLKYRHFLLNICIVKKNMKKKKRFCDTTLDYFIDNPTTLRKIYSFFLRLYMYTFDSKHIYNV